MDSKLVGLLKSHRKFKAFKEAFQEAGNPLIIEDKPQDLEEYFAKTARKDYVMDAFIWENTSHYNAWLIMHKEWVRIVVKEEATENGLFNSEG